VFRSYVRSLYFKLNGYDPIIKDPIAFFSASWLAERFDMNVLVMLRHPAAFCSSLKLKDWRFDFSSFLNQPLLMEQYLQRFDADIREYAANEKDIISQAALLWNCIYHTVGVYQEKHPEWMFVRHEDLSKDPVAQFQKICQSFDVKFTDKMQTLILDSSGAHNPKEQQPNNEFVRDSKANITNWKERLSKAEIQFIKEKTKDVSKAFYTESDW